MKYTTILLDADGTLLDFAAAQRSALFLALARVGIDAGEEVLTRYDQINHAQWKRLERQEVSRTAMLIERFAILAKECGFSYDAEAVNRLYGEALGEAAPMLDGARELLLALRPAGTLAIVTNGVPRSQHRRFALSGIDRMVDHVLISGEVGWEKPDPRFFEAALTRCGVTDLREVLVVGDSLTADIAGAASAGLDCCWYNPEGLAVPDELRPTYAVRRLDEVAALVLEREIPAVSTL